ncbi:MAG: hypothetical protein ABI873_11285 [Marmoricola sp.]
MRLRRLVAVAAMLGGALVGGVLLRAVSRAAPLWLAGGVLVVCAAVAYTATRRPGSDKWQ